MSIANFYREVKSEVLRVVWPSRRDTVTSVMLVFGMVVVSGLFFLLIDSLLFKLIKFILG